MPAQVGAACHVPMSFQQPIPNNYHHRIARTHTHWCRLFYTRREEYVCVRACDAVACDCCMQVSNIPPPQHLEDQIQKVQYWAICLTDGAMTSSHATPLLMKFHWLPIASRVEFKILLLTHRALTGRASGYIEQCVSRRQPVRSLRSSEQGVNGVTELSAWQPNVCVMLYRSI